MGLHSAQEDVLSTGVSDHRLQDVEEDTNVIENISQTSSVNSQGTSYNSLEGCQAGIM